MDELTDLIGYAALAAFVVAIAILGWKAWQQRGAGTLPSMAGARAWIEDGAEKMSYEIHTHLHLPPKHPAPLAGTQKFYKVGERVD